VATLIFDDFIHPVELDDLPDDDVEAFGHLVAIARRRLSEFEAANADNGVLRDAHYAFGSTVIALAKRFDVQPFAAMPVPRLVGLQPEFHKQILADIDYHLAQIKLTKAGERRRNSVTLEPSAKDAIRHYLGRIRDAIDASQLDERRKSGLRRRLDELEQELDKRRVSYLAIAGVAIAVAGIPGSLWASGEVVQKLTEKVWQVLAEAKSAEDEHRGQLPLPSSLPVALPNPRPAALPPPAIEPKRDERDEPSP
jgi:hypothetical protein